MTSACNTLDLGARVPRTDERAAACQYSNFQHVTTRHTRGPFRGSGIDRIHAVTPGLLRLAARLKRVNCDELFLLSLLYCDVQSHGGLLPLHNARRVSWRFEDG